MSDQAEAQAGWAAERDGPAIMLLWSDRGGLSVKGVIGSILPLAIAVTISPIPIIAEILLLFTKKPVANAASYLAGFILGVAGVLAILVVIAGTINLSAGSGSSTGAAILQLALGALLLAAALRQFRGRPKPGQEAAMPKWMNGIAGSLPASPCSLVPASAHSTPRTSSSA